MGQRPTRLLLVRHAQSEWNAVGRWQGQSDPPLTDLGRQQARQAASAIGSVDAVFASDLERARETADIMAEELGVGPVLVDADLRERNAGAWEGLTREEIEEQWPGYLTVPADDGFKPKRPPGWEADESVLARSRAAIDRIVEEVGGGDVLVITHGGLIYAVELSCGAPFNRLANLGGRWVVASNGDLRLGDRVLLLEGDGSRVTVPGEI